MRIERLRVDAFGKLAGYDTGPTPLGPLVVVLGPNEAGKSTLFSFLTTALYGFQPASRERNPHVPWDADEAGGEVWVRLSDRRCARVSRRLRSSPTGQLVLDDQTTELRNHAVPWVEHVPRTVFRQVFAVTLAELAGLDEETWARIQDRVLGAMGTTDLRPARAVAEELEAEASAIWRPNRRGNQRLRDLQEEVRALRGRRLDAMERDRVVRQRVEELERCRHALRELRTERERDDVVLERIQDLLPVKRQLERIASLRASGGPREALRTLPADPRGEATRLDEGLARVDASLDRLSAEQARPAEIVARYDEAARAVQSKRSEITGFVRRCAAAFATDASDETEATVREIDAQIRAASEQLFREPGHEEAAGRISLDILRDRIARAEAAGGTEAPGSARREGRTPRLAGVGAVAIGVGLASLAWGSLGGPALAVTAGVALCAVGATILLLRPRGVDVPGPVSGSVEEARAEVVRLVAGLPIRRAFLDPPGPALASAVERLQELLRRRARLGERLEELRSARADLEDEARRLAARLGEPAGETAATQATALEARLTTADRAEEAARAAEGELARIAERRARLQAERTDLERGRGELTLALRGFVGAEESDALGAAERRLEAHARADRLMEELERSRPDLADAEARIAEAERAGASWTLSDADLAVRRTRRKELTARIEELAGRAEALETEIAQIRDRETVDAIDGEIASLQDEEARLVRQRDRAWLVAQLLREADRRFREEHQPDLLRRASVYLERLTGGRYTRILVDELGEGDLFRLVGPGLPQPVPLARPISTGTLEQAYLSLRLAIVDHLDRERERLPLFIDEALVNWDPTRRDRGLDVLAELSESRQLFAFTCHPELAARLESRGARVLRLGS